MRLLRRPLLWIPLVMLLLFAGFILFGYTLLPGLVRSQADAYVAKNLPSKQLSLGAIHFDPWTLTLAINDIAIADKSAPKRPLVAVKSVILDASISSLWQRHARLDSVAVEAPVIDAVLRKDGSVNLAELIPPDDGSPVPRVWIGTLDVHGGKLLFIDDRRPTPQRKTLTPISFSLKDFATRDNGAGGFKLDAVSDEGEKFAWAGRVGMAPLGSEGSFSITGLKLATIGRFAGDLLPVTLTAGGVDLGGRYHFALPPAAPGGVARPALTADLSGLTLTGAALTASSGDKLSLDRLTIAPTKISLADDTLLLGDIALSGVTVARPGGERAAITSASLASTRYAITPATADIGAAAINGISVTGHGKGAETVALAAITIAPSRIEMTPRRAAVGTVAMSGLRLGARVAPDNSVSVPGLYPLVLPKSAPGPAWITAVAGFALTDAAVRVTVARPGVTKTLNLAPLSLKLAAFDSSLSAPLRLDFATTVNGKARIAAAGTASPTASDLALDLSGLPLAEFAALAPPNAVLVRSGTMAVKGRLKIARNAPSFTGNAAVANLDIAQRADGSDLLAWQQLDMTGIRYQSAPQQLAIERIAFDGINSHVIITREAKLNLATVAGVETPSLTAETPPEATPAKKIAVIAPVSNTLNAAGKLFPVKIGVVTVKNGTIGFNDYSIEPNFNASIKGFNGSVSGLSTAPGSQAKFDLHGYVIDKYAPVSITGRANVFAYDADTDLTASFKNIELPVFNPYSGRFAGYAIAKGKLSTTLHYRIVNRALNADHKVIVDQLTWGAATDSKEKVSLPIRLATSLLKDKNGVINLDVPVGGTLDDPKFKVWPIIWQIVGNVFSKLITAPFTAIGALFGGGDHAQYVDFAPGLAALPADASKSLAALAKGLGERPELNLDIPAGPGIREDGEALTTARLQAAVIGGDYAGLDPAKKRDKLKALYKTKFGKGAKFPDDAAKAGLFAGGEAKSAATTAQIAWLETELRPKFAPSDAELAALGQARADAVKQALLAENTIDPARVFVATDKAVTAKDDKIRMELSVK